MPEGSGENDFPSDVIWQNGLQLVANIALLLLIVSVDSQLYGFKAENHELSTLQRGRAKPIKAGDYKVGVWLMAMALLSLFAATVYYVTQMRSTTLSALFAAQVLLQSSATGLSSRSSSDGIR